MRRNKRNGQPDEGVCDIQHTAHWDELHVIRQHNGNGSTEQDVCDTRQTGLKSEMCAKTNNNTDDCY